jgi:SAM-dependent methyltransferase
VPRPGTTTDPAAPPEAAGRSSKARYAWERYEPYLRGRSILDVGADRKYLAGLLDDAATYWGVGLGGEPDQEIDLETGPLPFEDRSFDVVLCLDTLEHLSNPHAVFDELCRVCRRHVIVSLPCPWGDVYTALRSGPYRPSRQLKYYGLPVEAPGDRHKWFFSTSDARAFVTGRAALNGMEVVEVESMSRRSRSWGHPLRSLAEWVLFRGGVGIGEVYAGTLWAVLARPPDRAV